MTQKDQVMEAMFKNGGYATFNQLNNLLDFSAWLSKTPEASVRRIVQENDAFFKIKPGLWGLSSEKNNVLKKLGFAEKSKEKQKENDHSYYQGMLVEIGNLRNKTTYIPAQDKNKKYLEKRLGEVVTTTEIYNFTYPQIIRRAKTVDVIWFNSRQMPDAFYEVEHSTNIYNSLDKFCELQDFNAKFNIVADKCRRREFQDILQRSLYENIRQRVNFVEYDKLENLHNAELVPRII